MDKEVSGWEDSCESCGRVSRDDESMPVCIKCWRLLCEACAAGNPCDCESRSHGIRDMIHEAAPAFIRHIGPHELVVVELQILGSQ